MEGTLRAESDYPTSSRLALLCAHNRQTGLPFLIPHIRPPLLTCFIGSFIRTFLTPPRQSVFVSEMLVILALGLPHFTSAALLLSHTSNDPMKVLIAIIFFHSTSVFLVIFVEILTLTLFAPNSQTVCAGAILTKLTLVF